LTRSANPPDILIMDIPEITAGDLQSPRLEQELYPDLKRSLYYSPLWEPEWYVALARAGFISIAWESDGLELLLPELQTAYAVLEWNRRRCSRAVRRLLRRGELAAGGYTLLISGQPGPVATVADGIRQAYGPACWLCRNYRSLLLDLANRAAAGKLTDPEFHLVATELKHGDGTLLGGELGYTIGAIYTSLTGFLDRRDPRHPNLGKVQLAALGVVLEQRGYAFWNLGHPYMGYKLEMGAEILSRAAFLARWRRGIARKPAVPLTAEPARHPVAELFAARG